jgi:hypothetical protein
VKAHLCAAAGALLLWPSGARAAFYDDCHDARFSGSSFACGAVQVQGTRIGESGNFQVETTGPGSFNSGRGGSAVATGQGPVGTAFVSLSADLNEFQATAQAKLLVNTQGPDTLMVPEVDARLYLRVVDVATIVAPGLKEGTPLTAHAIVNLGGTFGTIGGAMVKLHLVSIGDGFDWTPFPYDEYPLDATLSSYTQEFELPAFYVGQDLRVDFSILAGCDLSLNPKADVCSADVGNAVKVTLRFDEPGVSAPGQGGRDYTHPLSAEGDAGAPNDGGAGNDGDTRNDGGATNQSGGPGDSDGPSRDQATSEAGMADTGSASSAGGAGGDVTAGSGTPSAGPSSPHKGCTLSPGGRGPSAPFTFLLSAAALAWRYRRRGQRH